MKGGLIWVGLCLILGLVLSGAVVQGQNSQEFDARAFFTGEWEVEYTHQKVGEEQEQEEDGYQSELFRWNITESSSVLLRGVSIDSEERTSSILIVLVDESFGDQQKPVRRGSFSATTGFLAAVDDHAHDELTEDEDEDESIEEAVAAKADNEDENEEEEEEEDEEFSSPGNKGLFDFSFRTYPGQILHSSGAWKSGDAIYQLVVTNPQAFILNVVQSRPGDKVPILHVFVGRKIIVQPEKTFFQKYSMFITLGVMMVIQMFLKGRARAGTEPEAPEPAQQPRSSGQNSSSPARVQRKGNAEVVTTEAK